MLNVTHPLRIISLMRLIINCFLLFVPFLDLGGFKISQGVCTGQHLKEIDFRTTVHERVYPFRRLFDVGTPLYWRNDAEKDVYHTIDAYTDIEAYVCALTCEAMVGCICFAVQEYEVISENISQYGG